MATREEIKEGIDYRLGELIGSGDWKCEATRSWWINNLLVYLHSQGVVIKVDRELPSISWSSSDPRYDQAYSRGVAKGMGLAEEAGWVATEPLVEE